jgi:decaprenyl-phosphate phosphoribosyltransferase
MAQLLYFILKTARPRQWVKNFALFAALVFSGFLFIPGHFTQVLLAFIVWCGLSSAVYIINDIVDASQDRKHPFKKKRPIASGDLPIPVALFVAILLLFTSLFAAFNLAFFFFLICLSYLLLNAVYSSYLKHVPILDVLSIAAGFILRVYGGAIVVNLHMSVWFLLTVISASLFLAVGKRQSERTLLKGLTGQLEGHRSTLSHYTTRLLDIYTSMFANTTWLTYALFAYQHQFEQNQGRLPTLFSKIPQTLVTQKWLMATVPLVIYGVMRYLQLVYEKNEGESPERVLLSDKPLLTAAIAWGVMVIVILYVLG